MNFSFYTLPISKNVRQLWTVVLSLSLLSGISVSRAASSHGSVAVRYDGSGHSDSKAIDHRQRIVYFSKDIKRLTKQGIVSYIKKTDKENCHEFYLMKKEKKEDDNTYVMKEDDSHKGFGNSNSKNDEAIQVSSYFFWDGTEDLRNAEKNKGDMSIFKFKSSDLITPDKYSNKGSSKNNNTNDGGLLGKNNGYVIAIVGILVALGITAVYFYTQSNEASKEKKN